MPYHHGDLRRALLDTALDAVAEHGPVALSLRDVARRADVSHAAPTHHFRDKTGLLTALAAEGWSLLADTLADTAERDPRFSELGVAYVVFATSHPAHFAVMRAPGLVRDDDPDLAAARGRAGEQLRAGAGRHTGSAGGDSAGSDSAGSKSAGGDSAGSGSTGSDSSDGDSTTALAAWALVHGLSALLLEGSVTPGPGTDVAELARSVTGRLRPGR